MTRSAFVLLASLAGGCTSTRMVSREDLGPFTRGGLRDGVPLRTTDTWRSRLDPNAQVRLAGRDGQMTRVLRAGDLSVNQRGVFVRDEVPVALAADRVQVGGLSEVAARALAATCPRGATLREVPGGYELRADGNQLAAWISDAVDVVAIETAPSEDTIICQDDSKEWFVAELDAPGCRIGNALEVGRILERDRGGPNLGRWQFHVPGAGWQAVAQGWEVLERLDTGLSLRMGWSWDEITGVEVTDVSGGKTLGAIIGTTALAIALAPLAYLGNGGIRLFPGDGPPDAGGGGGGGGGGSSGGSAAEVVRVGAELVVAGAASDAPADGSWQGALREEDAGGIEPLFDGRTRRRAIVRIFAVGEAAAELRRPDALMDGVALGLRFVDLIEIGGGVRHLAARTGEGDLHHSAVGFFRLGLHLPLDAAHRFAVPLGFDVGGGEDVNLFRLNFGLRMRVSKNWFAGVTALNPTRIRYHGDSPAAGRDRWSFTSGAELGVAF